MIYPLDLLQTVLVSPHNDIPVSAVTAADDVDDSYAMMLATTTSTSK